MGRLLELPRALARFGVPYVEVPGWQGRGSGSLNGQVAVGHHVGGAPGLITVINGRSDLPGPLAQVNEDLDGVAHIVASGIANHAGGPGNGPWRGFAGNTFLVGLEADNWPDYHWDERQLWGYWGIMASFLWLMGKDASWACGHKEIAVPPGRKIDPDFRTPAITMDGMRAAIQDRLDFPQGHNAPEPPIELEDIPPMDSFIAIVTTPSGAKQYYEINKHGGNISVILMGADTAKGLGTQFFKRGGMTMHGVSGEYVKWHVKEGKHNLNQVQVQKIGQD